MIDKSEIDISKKMPVLIMALRTGAISEVLLKGFLNCGANAKLINYDEQVFKNTSIYHSIKRRIYDRGCEKQIEACFNNILSALKGEISGGEYRAIVIMKGHYLSRENRSYLSKIDIPLIVWTYDSISRAPMQVDVTTIADHIFCLDGGDARKFGKKASWLPLGYNDQLFRPSDDNKDIDVMISGAIGRLYNRRREFLVKLGQSYIAKNHKCIFIGTTGHKWNDSLIRLGSIEWIAKRVDAQLLGSYQARSKVCVNIHQDDGKWPVNLSFFSIPGSVSCQLAENKEYLKNFMEPGIDYEEFLDNEYLSKLEMLLKDDERRNKMAEQGYLKSKKYHTMSSRAREILRKISELEEITHRKK